MLTLRRASLPFALVLGLAACGSKHGDTSICNQIPAPAECQEVCDPTPGASNTCPAGYHCSPDGKCDAVCTVNGGQCGDGYVCTTDGACMPTDPGGSGMMPDADCPNVVFTPMRTTPSIELLLDRSGSMDTNFGGTSRYEALHAGLTDPNTGAITTTQASAYFGAALYSDQEQCPPSVPLPAGYSVPRALNNASAIDALISSNNPNGNTPTAEWITAIAADFAANPPPAGSPPIILLATDGEPNGCGGGNGSFTPSVNAAAAAYAQGVRLFVIGLANLNTGFLQQVANAGVGVTAGMPDAPYYTADDPASLAMAFNTIINGVLSCDLSLTGTVDTTQAMDGVVTLNGTDLTYGTDWTLDANGMVIHLTGAACDTLKNSTNPMVNASFPCGSVIQ